jgi:nucleoside-diphosphate-sugar epimerase
LGGTGFVGRHVVQCLSDAGHSLAVFHRGRTSSGLPASVQEIPGDRRQLSSSIDQFREFAPEVVVDLIAYTDADLFATLDVFKGLSKRLVVISSMDVYRAYGRFLGADSSSPNPLPHTETSELRTSLYPYRAQATDMNDLLYNYEKNLVERAVLNQTDIPSTVLRLPCVYGPGDRHHRLFEYLKRMDDRRPAILLSTSRAAWRWTRGYVGNVADAIALAATDERATGQVFNVGDEKALAEAEWIEAIGRAAGWKGRVQVIAEADLPSHLKTSLDWRHDLVGDTRKLRRELGYREPISFEEGMTKSVAWQRAHPPAAFDSKLFDYAAEDAVLSRVMGGGRE